MFKHGSCFLLALILLNLSSDLPSKRHIFHDFQKSIVKIQQEVLLKQTTLHWGEVGIFSFEDATASLLRLLSLRSSYCYPDKEEHLLREVLKTQPFLHNSSANTHQHWTVCFHTSVCANPLLTPAGFRPQPGRSRTTGPEKASMLDERLNQVDWFSPALWILPAQCSLWSRTGECVTIYTFTSLWTED